MSACDPFLDVIGIGADGDLCAEIDSDLYGPMQELHDRDSVLDVFQFDFSIFHN
jgi:hypothetical protein